MDNACERLLYKKLGDFLVQVVVKAGQPQETNSALYYHRHFILTLNVKLIARQRAVRCLM